MAYVRARQSKTQPGAGIASRYRALLLTHHSLEEKLADELGRPLPDAAIVQRLKRRKLAIKDELAPIDRLLDAIGVKGTADDAAPRTLGVGRPAAGDEAKLAPRRAPEPVLGAARPSAPL